MKTLGWVAAGYLVVAGASQMVSSFVQGVNVQLPDVGGSLLQFSPPLAAGVDLATATVIWLAFLRG